MTRQVMPESTGEEIAAAVLEDLKDPGRWCKHVFFHDGSDPCDGPACLMGAAQRVTGVVTKEGVHWHRVAYENAAVWTLVEHKLAQAMGFPDRDCAVDFNNNENTTHEDLIRRLCDARAGKFKKTCTE